MPVTRTSSASSASLAGLDGLAPKESMIIGSTGVSGISGGTSLAMFSAFWIEASDFGSCFTGSCVLGSLVGLIVLAFLFGLDLSLKEIKSSV